MRDKGSTKSRRFDVSSSLSCTPNATAIAVVVRCSGTASSKWSKFNLTNLVSFGDSFTDDSRLSYFSLHRTLPPPRWRTPANYSAADGGRSWVQYVKQYTGCSLHNYAIGGSVCSIQITPIWYNKTMTYFDLEHDQLPMCVSEANTTKPYLTTPPSSTVYTIWIGTNDLGTIIKNEQRPGKGVHDYIDCVYDQLERLYNSGARYFILINVAPLDKAPLYAAPPYDVGPSFIWTNKPKDHALVARKMKKLVKTANKAYKTRTARLQGAEVAVFDVHGLMMEIYKHPGRYLNGSAPANSTGYARHFEIPGQVPASPDSFLWWDTLHPSEQTARAIAKHFVDVVKGKSPWGWYWSG
ncbi:carbohydrate esterase family 16 protein [Piedraia hortae CBS 480.64]|uniref:Carbohydrate esterase family 16 protein n=1 Tax=Piedraia hortae CBS 480.64 TaxID=1314780 RepID=A0A6A7BSU8_9PEZI|nr:carbohydrate esterase family 16 protein [Piedraia hortae CBS 480.64]